MNAKAVVPLIAGLGIAGLAGKLGFDYLKKAQGATPKTVKLWAVNQDVPRGSTIDDVNLRELTFPLELAPADAVIKKEDLVGRVPHTGVPANVPVLSTMLLAKGATPGIHVPAGFRAIAVKIDDGSGVDNHLQPSCHVDVVGYFQTKNNATNKNETIARTIVENVQVAAVGPRLAPDAPEKGDPKDKKGKTEQAKPARAVTLLVKPEHVPIIHLAEQKGEIKLSMRGDDDTSFGSASATKTVKDYEVTGVGAPEPEEKSSLGDLLGTLTGQKPEPKPEPVAVAKAEPVEPPAPKYENIVVLYNGNEKHILGWLPGDPNVVEISASEAANVFEDSPKPRTTHRTKSNSGEKTPAGKDARKQPEPKPQTEPEPATEPETEQMPKELIG